MISSRILWTTTASLLLAAGAATGGSVSAQAAGCHFANGITHVLHLTFDNVHYRRDNPNVPSDMEQMPALLNFLTKNGTLSSNHHTPLISHTADDIVTAMTGLYPDRQGLAVSNSFGVYLPASSGPSPAAQSQSDFVYWTTLAKDGVPVLVTDTGNNTPAPWVPFTRAGCDFGAYSTADIEMENTGDISTVFGPNSPQAQAAAANPAKAKANYLGVAVHCAQGSPRCTGSNAQFAAPDALPGEPGGYSGFSALWGDINVQPVVSPGGPVKDINGNVIIDPASNLPGFVTTFDPTAAQSLGYVASMFEAGIPVVYFYMADLHDENPEPPTGTNFAFGPGEAGYVSQAQAYNQAFTKFFARLAADGITPANTLFIVTTDENDHFVGGAPSPSNCDGVNVPCTYSNIGEVDALTNQLLASQRNNTTPFFLHFDDAPNFYIAGNPAQTDPTTIQLEQDAAALMSFDAPRGTTVPMSAFIADRSEMKLLHMVTSDPLRLPSFTMFGNPDFFFETGSPSSSVCGGSGQLVFQPPRTSCSEFAWNHGDVQTDITNTWMAMVGPGVRKLGVEGVVWSDHTDIRPTMLTLLGLPEDYVHDGRVLIERLAPGALPAALTGASGKLFAILAPIYKQLTAPVGALATASLTYANKSVISNATNYNLYISQMQSFTSSRDALAAQIKAALDGAAFNNTPLNASQVASWYNSANSLIQQMQTLAGH